MGQHRQVPPLLPWGPGVAQTYDHSSQTGARSSPSGGIPLIPLGQVSGGDSVMTTAVEVGVCLLAQVHALVLCQREVAAQHHSVWGSGNS